MDGWWVDLVVLVLMIISGLLVWLSERQGVEHASGSSADELAAVSAERPRLLYPAQLVRQAGYHADRVEQVYWAAKLVTGLFLSLLVLEFGRGELPLWAVALTGGAGSFLPEVWLWSRRRRRRADIADGLSFFIHLLVVYLRSGQNLPQAFSEAAASGLDPKNPLRDEIDLINREIEAGRDRDRAFELLAERTGVSDLKRLAAVISVGYRAGSPIIETLRAQADLLRSRQQQKITEMVNRRSMEAMLPMMLICFPVFVVLVMFPAAVQVLDVLTMIGELF